MCMAPSTYVGSREERMLYQVRIAQRLNHGWMALKLSKITFNYSSILLISSQNS